MRILFLVPRFWPETGGVERHTLALATVLLQRGHTVKVVTQRVRHGVPWREKHPAGFEVVRLRLGRLFGIPKTGILCRPLVHTALINETIAFKPDVVHVHDVALWTHWWQPVAGNFAITPLKSYITFHGWEGRFPPDPDIVAQRRQAAVEAQGHLSVGAFIERWYGTRADALTYGGIDPGALPAADAPLADPGVALYAGRLARDTGIKMVIEALARLPGRPLTLRVAGAGPERERLIRLAAKLKLPVDWLEEVANPLPLFARHGTVFAGGYLSILEALACGARVFAVYDHELRRDYLTGFPHARRFLSIAGNPDELAAQLTAALVDARLAELREEGRAWARLQTWDAVADLYENLWRTGKSACVK